MNKPKVLHISTALSWRGGEQQLAYLLQELEKTSDAQVLCAEGSKMAKHCASQNIPFSASKKSSGFDLGFSKKIKNLCFNNEIDLIHVHDAHAHTFAIIAAALFGNKTPIILSRRVDFPIKGGWLSHFKYNHKRIAKILCVSDEIKRITAAGVEDPHKLTTVYSGIDLEKFTAANGDFRKELGLKEHDFLIGNTSALADHKDYFTFIDVAERVCSMNKRCQFVIIGNGPIEKEIMGYAQAKNLGKRLVFLGFREDVPKILSDLDCFLITSKTEGLGTSILDAFACKVPVVATAAGGIPELVIDQKTGLLKPVKDVEALSNAVLSLLDNERLASELSQKAFEKVQQFSKSQTAKKTLAAYLEVLN